MLHDTITKLMDGLAACDDDAAIHLAIARLGTLRRLTSGDDRACVCWATIECRGLLTAGGRLRRAAASAARAATIAA
jgi:hypothetical protein